MFNHTVTIFLKIPGGLAEEVTEKILHAAFIPFGDIMDIQIPLDYETGKLTVCDRIHTYIVKKQHRQKIFFC